MKNESFIKLLERISELHKVDSGNIIDVNLSVMAMDCAKKIKELHERNLELERLARIGEATEKAYSENLKLHKWDTIAERVEYVAWDIESLLEWAESEERVILCGVCGYEECRCTD